jgi:hypothetical protein
LREPEYSGDHAVRRVRHNGEIKWQGRTVYVGGALSGEPVGLIEGAEGWAVSFGTIGLGVIGPGADHLRTPKRT